MERRLQVAGATDWCLVHTLLYQSTDSVVTYVFQLHNAPTHRARETVQLLLQETPEVISTDLWPTNRPYLNPIDY